MMDSSSPIALSVIIPTYNRLWALPRAIESCRGSAHPIEILVVDDGSRDGTREWLRTQHDVTVITQENTGKGWAVNRAFAQARGTYVRFLDSDDWLLASANDAQLTVAEATGADVVVGGMEGYDEDGNVVVSSPWVDTDDFIARQLGEGHSAHYSAYLFRREFVRDIPHRPEFAVVDDRMYVLEVALKHPAVSAVHTATLAHVMHHSHARIQHARGVRSPAGHLQLLTVYERILRRLAAAGELTQRRRRAAAGVLWGLAHRIAYVDPYEGAEVADWVERLVPGFRPTGDDSTSRTYRAFGFRGAQRLFRIRRALLAPFRRRPSGALHDFPQ